MLIDPHRVLLRRPPRDERDLAIAGNNNWAPVCENVSYVPDWLSDALCVLATGGGFGTRKLYEDDEEALFDAQRPVMMNGIEVMGTARELLERLNGLVQEDERKKKEWPKQANALSGQLNRIAPHLRALGLDMDTTREGKARKTVIHLRLEQAGKTSSASSASSATGEGQADLGVDEDVLADDGHPQADDHQPLADDDVGVADDADDHLHDCSELAGSADAVQQPLMWEADV